MKARNMPVKAIKLYVVKRCARSAQTLPLATTLSKLDSWPNFALRAASRSLATFCCGVSFGGAGDWAAIVEARFIGFEVAYGPVDVKRVASATERGIFD